MADILEVSGVQNSNSTNNNAAISASTPPPRPQSALIQRPTSSSPRPHSAASSHSHLSFASSTNRMDSLSGAGGGGGDEADEESSLRSISRHAQLASSSACSSSFNLHRHDSNASSSGGGGGAEAGPSAPTANNIVSVVNGMSGNVARTTTISTIAMESNTSATSKCSPTRLVIALLQTPHQALHLKIIELTPCLLKLPDNLPEADDYMKNHTQVIKNLQSKQSPVEELLRQADSLIATQKPRAEVYAAMADSLGQTWKDLNGILDQRRIVLELAFTSHQVIQSCVDRMNELHSEYSKFNYIPNIEEHVTGGKPQDIAASLRKLKEDRADVLKRVSQSLDACQQLINKINDFNLSIDSRQLFLKRDVEYATKQVHRWLERLHDRRMILEERFKIKREQFEEMADFLVHDREMSGLLQELERLRKASQEFSLGKSVETAETQRDELEKMVREMKNLQERALLTARKLEQQNEGQPRGRFYQRSGLKQKIYEILGTVNDLITDSIDFELSLVDAKEFFHLAEMANAKLDEMASAATTTSGKDSVPKSQLNSLTEEALSKGQCLLDSLGWDTPRTRGVRSVYDELSERKTVVQDEIEHLQLLDEYNHFLESLNKAYENILNLERSSLRLPTKVPVDLPGVTKFRQEHENTMADLEQRSSFKQLLVTLEQIYPGLSEEEKMSTEEKVNQLKALSNLLVQLILQRLWLSGEWLKILELDRTEWERLKFNEQQQQPMAPDEISTRLAHVVEKIGCLYKPIQQQLEAIHRSDPDLITSTMEEKITEIINKYRDRENELQAVHKIRDICQIYKVKLDHHLLGKLDAASTSTPDAAPSEPRYFPVLSDSLVQTTLRNEEVLSNALERIIKEQLQNKLSSTLANFFQPLITNFRQEVLEAQQCAKTTVSEKSPEEQSWERYFERLKESYVIVTRELEAYLGLLADTSRQVEEGLKTATIDSNENTVETIEKHLNDLTEFRVKFERNMEPDLKRRLQRVLGVVGHEEPPVQAEQEERTLRTISTAIIHDQLSSSISQKQDTLTRQLTEKMIHNDLDMINRTLNELISELEHPCNYGNNLNDAQTYLASFERFERTVETLRDKLSRLLTTAGMSDTDVKAQNLLGKLNLLVDRKGKRRELILLSLDYFKLINKSYEHYNQANQELQGIMKESKNPDLNVVDIERLLKQLESVKLKEGEQERRLQEIERISKIIFDVSQEEEIRQHYPLRDRNTEIAGEITRVESDLTSLLETIRRQLQEVRVPSPPLTTKTRTPPPTPVPEPNDLELELESQIVVPVTTILVETVAKAEIEPSQTKPVEPQEVVEELIVPIHVTRPRSQEMCTQTSSSNLVMDDEELDAKTKEYLKEKERMTVAVLEALRQSMSPLPPPPQTVEKETQFEEMEDERPPSQKVDRDTDTQTISERRRSFETQTDEFAAVVTKSVETGTSPVDEALKEASNLLQQQQQRPQSRTYTDPTFIQPLKDLVVNEGEKVVLECKTTGRIQKIIWLKDGLEIVANPDYKTELTDGSTARLTIDEVLPEDSAIFTCRAFGEVESVMVETSGRLTIREPVTSLLVPPRFLPHPPASTGEHGKHHVIQVKVEGNPLPTVQWFKGGSCIDTSPDYIITFNNGVCEVQFDELIKDLDDGVYTCVAINKLGDCETSVELEITGDVDIAKKLSRQPPEITKPLPKNVMSRAGQKVRLECEFESHTDFNVVWIKDDTKILTKTNCAAEIITEGPTSTMIFDEAYPLNSGKYTVLIRNAGGECHSDCQIVVKGLLPAETSDSELNISDGEAVKPSVKMPLKDARARVGESLRLDCVIVANPEPEVIWYKNGVPLKESPNHHLLFQGDKCSLVIDHAEQSDNGIYSVSALNNCGEASSKCEVLVFEKSPEVQEVKPVAAPVFVKMIQDEMVTAGHTFSLEVELTPDPENPDVVTNVTWWKNNSQITPSERVEIQQDGLQHRLHFKEVDLLDKGNYMVKAVNPGGDARCFGCLIVKENFEKAVPEEVPSKEQRPAPTSSPPQQPKVEPQKKIVTSRVITKPPRFVIPLEGKMVDEGDRNISLRCKIDASPPAAVKWTKNNGTEPLEPSPDSNLRLTYNEKNGEVELYFTFVNVKDGGRYTCHASNEHGIASSVTDLIVKKTTFPPVFSKRLQSITIEEGKRIYLEVDVFGKPAPQVEWQLNGIPMPACVAEGITLKSDTPTRHSIIIASGKKARNEGEYKVIARNEAGEACSSCSVNIIDQSGGVEIPVEIQRTEVPVNQSSKSQSSKSVNEKSSSVVESSTTTTTIITETEEHLYESRVTQVISPTPMPPEDLAALTVRKPPPPLLEKPQVASSSSQQQTMETSTSSLLSEEALIPGPEPEILIAPKIPSTWAKSKNQVLEKKKKFEEESSEASSSEAPVGGVRIIPIMKSEPSPPPPPLPPKSTGHHVRFSPNIDQGEAPRIEPILPPIISPLPLEEYMIQQPETRDIHDFTSTVYQDSFTVGDTHVEREEHQRSSRDATYIKPSKFVPEKMRESDHDSEVESTVIPPKWVPPSSTGSVAPPPPPLSAFVPITTQASLSSSTMSMTSSSQRFIPQSQIAPQPQPTPVATRVPETVGVRSIAKLWPPNSPVVESSTLQTSSTSTSSETKILRTLTPTTGGASVSRLSPLQPPPERSARSPTPNREALEMDKLWSKPLRFASPTPQTVPGLSPVPPSSIPAQSPKPQKPEVPPKPSSASWMKRTTPNPYSPVVSPIPPTPTPSPLGMKPEVPPKPSYLKSPVSPQPQSIINRSTVTSAGGDASMKENLYYVSTVSTPRTTPIPPQLGWTSPLTTTPEVPAEMSSSYHSSFQEKREFFESTMTSSGTEERQISSPPGFPSRSLPFLPMDIHPSGISLLDQSLLPPPGEPPVFMYQPPPPIVKPNYSTSSSSKSTVVETKPGGATSKTTTVTTSSSSSSSSKQVDKMSQQQQRSATLQHRKTPLSRAKPGTAPPFKTFEDLPVFQSSSERNVEELSHSHFQKATFTVPKTTSLVAADSSRAIVPFRRPDAPYIRPTKFVPVLDYFSSGDKKSSGDGSIKPKWKPGDDASQLSTWRKVTYEVPLSSKRKSSLSSLVDKNMQDINNQFKSSIGQMSQGLCYNRLDRKIQSDLGTVGSGPQSVAIAGTDATLAEDSNPLIYFKYDFGYEFGIASPRHVRATSEPPVTSAMLLSPGNSTAATSRPNSWMAMGTSASGDESIVLPIIHETSEKK